MKLNDAISLVNPVLVQLGYHDMRTMKRVVCPTAALAHLANSTGQASHYFCTKNLVQSVSI